MGSWRLGSVAVAVVLVSLSCAPRFEGTGTLVPRSQVVDGSTTDTGSDDLALDDAGIDLIEPGQPGGGAVSAPASRRTTTPTASRPSGGQTTVRRGGTIKVGGLFPLSGGLSALGTPAFQSANAYFRFLNSRGGIDGTKIEYIPCDDQADDTRSTTCAKKLVEQDGVFIMGPSFTPFSLTVIGQLEQGGVPWVGYDGINIEGFQARNTVTVGSAIETMAHALLPWWYRTTEQRLGRAPSKFGLVVLQSAPSKTYAREAREVICPALGCEIVREQTVNFADTEYATVCRNMQNERVDTVWIITDPASAVKLLVQCREINYIPPAGWLGQHGVYMDLTLQQSGAVADGTVANGAVLPDTVDHPANREMKDIVRTYYGQNASFGYFASLGYASARLVEDVVREAFRGGGELTRDGMIAAAGRMTAYGCHGLCKDVNLRTPAATHGGNHNIWMVKAENGAWAQAAGPIDAWQAESWPCRGKPYGAC